MEFFAIIKTKIQELFLIIFMAFVNGFNFFNKKNAECKAKDDAIALLTEEKEVLAALTQRQANEIEALGVQVNQYLRRVNLLSKSIENVKFEKSAYLMTLETTKKELKQSSLENHVLSRCIVTLTEDLENALKKPLGNLIAVSDREENCVEREELENTKPTAR